MIKIMNKINFMQIYTSFSAKIGFPVKNFSEVNQNALHFCEKLLK